MNLNLFLDILFYRRVSRKLILILVLKRVIICRKFVIRGGVVLCSRHLRGLHHKIGLFFYIMISVIIGTRTELVLELRRFL